jgi:hypothetical protein
MLRRGIGKPWFAAAGLATVSSREVFDLNPPGRSHPITRQKENEPETRSNSLLWLAILFEHRSYFPDS